jgi:DNA-binding transcriptional LysR family regulator
MCRPGCSGEKGQIVPFDGRARLVISDPEVMLDAALMHLGIARMGRHHAFAALRRGELVAVLPRQHVAQESAMFMYYPHRTGLAPRVRVVVDFLLARFAQDETLHSAP